LKRDYVVLDALTRGFRPIFGQIILWILSAGGNAIQFALTGAQGSLTSSIIYSPKLW
jgi:hypothetical protein